MQLRFLFIADRVTLLILRGLQKGAMNEGVFGDARRGMVRR